MNIPQMQQRWTGYSSEGSGSLLGAVLGARQADVSERQAKVAERSQKLKEDYFADDIQLRKDQNKAYKDALSQLKSRNKIKGQVQDYYRNRDVFKKAEQSPWSLGTRGALSFLDYIPGIGLGTRLAGNLGYFDNLGGKHVEEYMGDVMNSEQLEDRFDAQSGGVPIANDLVLPDMPINDPAIREIFTKQFLEDDQYSTPNIFIK